MATDGMADDTDAVASAVPAPHDTTADEHDNALVESGATNEIEDKRIAGVGEQDHATDNSVSSGSDADPSRAETEKGKDDDKVQAKHAPATRKPTTFKAVSINEKFLAAKAITSGGPSKGSDKAALASSSSATPAPSSSSLSTSRPRLVAKSGPGLRDPVSNKSSHLANGKLAPGPDPNAVWNKNRPAPPPEPRTYTDEELKKYGIHMANRLPAEDLPGQSNWADIEEDDDDWAPDTTITWTDGTKMKLPALDENPPVTGPRSVSEMEQPGHVPLPQPSAPLAGDNDEWTPVRPVADTQGPAVGTASTSLRASLSVHKPSSTTVSGKGLVLKSGGASEKHALLARPQGQPAPIKSPWAPLPPIDKASPGTLLQDQSIRAGRTREDIGGTFVHGAPIHSQPQPSPIMSREIEVDDFSRQSWRYGSANSTRELFNSQSGRYEPVKVQDRWAAGHRAEPMVSKQPALLQRPPHEHGINMDIDGGAAGLETSTLATPPDGDNHPNRPRGFSNVSAGSSPPLISASHTSAVTIKGGHDGKTQAQLYPASETSTARRGSLTASIESLHSGRNFPFSHQGAPHQPPQSHWPGRNSTMPGHVYPSHPTPVSRPPSEHHLFTSQEHHAPSVTDAAQMPSAAPRAREEDVEIQTRIMREKRELAVKRRREEEEKEEAARRERIRLKLEAMGPPPERKAPKNEATRENEKSGKDENNGDQKKTNDKNLTGESVGKDGRGNDGSGKGVAPTQSLGSASASAQPTADGLPSRSVANGNDGENPVSAHFHIHNNAKITDTLPHVRPASSGGSLPHTSSATAGNINNPWDHAGRTERLPQSVSWGAGGQQPPMRNVWASPSNDRGLGNGTFNPDLGRIPDASLQPQGNQQRQPQSQAQPQQRTSRYVPAPARRELVEPRNATADARNKWASSVMEGDSFLREAGAVQRTERDRQLAERGMTVAEAQPVIKETWRQVQRTIPLPGFVSNSINITKTGSNTDITHPASSPLVPDHPRKDVLTMAIPQEETNMHPPPSEQQQPQQQRQSHHPASSVAPGRSRFFPSDDISAQEMSRHRRLSSLSPPPPTTIGHPAYDGDVSHPLVSLPKPQPVVRLPPAPVTSHPRSEPMPGPSSTAASFPSGNGRATQVQAVPPSSVSNSNWQDKFNNLLRPGTVTSPKSMVIEPASRSALDHHAGHKASSATVSLPTHTPAPSPVSEPAPPRFSGATRASGRTIANLLVAATSKPMSEDCFEQQEMGSLPQVRIPHRAPMAWGPPPTHARTIPRRFLVLSQSRDLLSFAQDAATGSITVPVHIPGMKDTRFVTISGAPPHRSGVRPSPEHGGGSGNRGSGPRGSGSVRGGNHGHIRGPGNNHKTRDYEQAPHMPFGPDTVSRGGRGGFRGRHDGSNWPRQSPSSTPA